MTGTDSFGGICPNCGYTKMFLRYGSTGFFEFDACPKCGFSYGTNHFDEAVEGAKFWEGSCLLLRMFKEDLRKYKLPFTRHGLYRLTLLWEENAADVYNVFKYTKEDVKRIMDTFKEKVEFT